MAEIEVRRERLVKQRTDHALVSLVGYTNAGKSTLMNALTGADVYVADKLFATLDPRTRNWSVPHWGDVLLSDTVGFVRDLPHSLVASFKSTLEEARQADLLLHVVDISNPEALQQANTVELVLDEIGVEVRNFILVLNKADKVTDRTVIDELRARYTHSVTISAKTGEGLEQLGNLVAELLSDGFVDIELETGVGNGKLFAWLAEHAEVKSREYLDDRVKLVCKIPRQQVFRVKMPDVHIVFLDEAEARRELLRAEEESLVRKPNSLTG